MYEDKDTTREMRFAALTRALGRPPTDVEFVRLSSLNEQQPYQPAASFSIPITNPAYATSSMQHTAVAPTRSHWTTMPGVTYNNTHGRPSNVPSPALAKFGESLDAAAKLAKKQPKGKEKPGVVEDLGNDPGGTSSAEKEAHAAAAKAQGLSAAPKMTKLQKLSAYQGAVLSGADPHVAAKQFGLEPAPPTSGHTMPGALGEIAAKAGQLKSHESSGAPEWFHSGKPPSPTFVSAAPEPAPTGPTGPIAEAWYATPNNLKKKPVVTPVPQYAPTESGPVTFSYYVGK